MRNCEKIVYEIQKENKMFADGKIKAVNKYPKSICSVVGCYEDSHIGNVLYIVNTKPNDYDKLLKENKKLKEEIEGLYHRLRHD